MYVHLSAYVCLIYEKTNSFVRTELGKQNIKNKKVHLLLSLYNPNFSFISIGSFWYGMHLFLVNLRLINSLHLLILLLIGFLIEEHMHPGS